MRQKISSAGGNRREKKRCIQKGLPRRIEFRKRYERDDLLRLLTEGHVKDSPSVVLSHPFELAMNQTDRRSPSKYLDESSNSRPCFRVPLVIVLRILADISCDESEEDFCGENDHPRGNRDTLKKLEYQKSFDAILMSSCCSRLILFPFFNSFSLGISTLPCTCAVFTRDHGQFVHVRGS